MPDHPTGRRGRPRRARCVYIVVEPDDPRLNGQPCRAYEEPGLVTIYCSRLDMSARLASDMTERLDKALGESKFVQRWDDQQDKPRWLDLEPRHWQMTVWDWARVELVSASRLPGDTCRYLDLDPGLLWLLSDAEASQALCDWLNAYLSLLLGDGLWEPGGEDAG